MISWSFLIYCFLPLISTVLTDSCADGWVNASHYGLGCLYINHDSARSWEDTAIFCQEEKNATLLEMENYEQLQFLMGILNQEGGIDNRSFAYWTAGTDIGREGKWIWQGSLRPVPEEIWHVNFPMWGITANCLSLEPVYNYSFDGMEADCNEDNYTICQKR